MTKENVPELEAGFLSYYTLHWIGHYLNIGSKLTDKDIPKITPEDKVNYLHIYLHLYILNEWIETLFFVKIFIYRDEVC